VEKGMQNFQGTDLAHPYHMQFVITDQMSQHYFPLRTIKYCPFNGLVIKFQKKIPQFAIRFIQLNLRIGEIGLKATAGQVEKNIAVPVISFGVKTQVF
jgi:hypothetical protein